MFLVCLSGPHFLRNDLGNDSQDSGCRISPHIWFSLASIVNNRNQVLKKSKLKCGRKLITLVHSTNTLKAHALHCLLGLTACF